jgi:hypothetical protein
MRSRDEFRALPERDHCRGQEDPSSGDQHAVGDQRKHGPRDVPSACARHNIGSQGLRELAGEVRRDRRKTPGCIQLVQTGDYPCPSEPRAARLTFKGVCQFCDQSRKVFVGVSPGRGCAAIAGGRRKTPYVDPLIASSSSAQSVSARTSVASEPRARLRGRDFLRATAGSLREETDAPSAGLPAVARSVSVVGPPSRWRISSRYGGQLSRGNRRAISWPASRSSRRAMRSAFALRATADSLREETDAPSAGLPAVARSVSVVGPPSRWRISSRYGGQPSRASMSEGWCARRESNPRPTGSKPVALSI